MSLVPVTKEKDHLKNYIAFVASENEQSHKTNN